MIEGPSILDLQIAVSRADRALTRHIEQACEQLNWAISAEELQVLRTIQSIKRPTLIAEHLGRATPTISHIIKRLDEWGFITRVKDSTDGRARILEVTESGQAMLDRVYGLMFPLRAPDATLGSAERIAKRVA